MTTDDKFVICARIFMTHAAFEKGMASYASMRAACSLHSSSTGRKVRAVFPALRGPGRFYRLDLYLSVYRRRHFSLLEIKAITLVTEPFSSITSFTPCRESRTVLSRRMFRGRRLFTLQH
jgi:hypothetical protein